VTNDAHPVTIDVSLDPDAAIAAAVEAVTAGECIVLPTDTVYGIGANALDSPAVQRLLDAKRRGRDMPPPVLLAEPALLPSLTSDISVAAQALADEFWPGALTLIVRAQHALRMELGDRGQTIAVRVPDHEFARRLLRRTGPLAVSSANLSGHPAALTAAEARDQLGDTVSVYLDGGTCADQTPSTIIDVSGEGAVVLRAGRLSEAELRAVVPGIECADERRPESPADESTAEEPGVGEEAGEV
jgi:tRNA threonylcarbamoyl adenosine modification protein (Sua5/YciO/YrdC/YwlC family)